MDRRLVFSTASELVSVPPETVVYITADGNYSSIMLADGRSFVLTMQLGQILQRIAETISHDQTFFIRVGKSLIVNMNYITYVKPATQKLIMSDCRSFRHEITASREALKEIKIILEKEAKK